MVAKKAAAKKPASSRSKKKEPEKTFTLTLTTGELEHLRDLFSVMLPSDDDSTVSSALAEMRERTEQESSLWEKIYALCGESGVEIGDDAPDFVVMSTVGLYEIEHTED